VLVNTSNTRVAIPDVFSLKMETVPGSATRYLYTLAAYEGLDYVSGGSLLASTSTLIGGDATSQVNAYFGAITSVDVAKTHISTGALVDVVPVIDSTLVFRFGAPSEASATHGATTAQHIVRWLPAVCLGPNTSVALYLYGDSQSATPTFEPTLAWMER